ncbi:hypothetical protein WME73_46080 [Sorangium sp. So ce302]|uniref:hypothetical protein n=1 Tax=Sorangium sp. So ce302 TaxID=3133297 RepID=UPI003F5F5B2C
MGQLLEVVFEGLQISAAQDLVNEIVARSAGVARAVLEGDDCDPGISVADLLGRVSGAALLLLRSMDLPKYGTLEDVSVRLLRSEELIDVELGVDLDDVECPRALEDALFCFAVEMAERHEVSRFYAGLEPAADEETRLFTGREKGPFQFPKS